ncbi:Hypothetical_protein [Hexamita inflata]|uniref:Hypothetical_protein n=1 Tax=Hexamita inflata TaxID=28002 RepID=A0AA86UTD2_9EUKA|nr:Hypothetical protein HINF_LOCUS34262 [Hexamita inflata]CAI9949271.1 Hypothetical protein HINF_LOCUS36916 [Hexamita inflata]CAI9963969.1 Hypothetical protein HINF_LOCUS51614 [Hexamita inflata]CAI9963971.1 Hypothetical protein HINF_LOCUS51616 [Hexamita inflata]
MNSNSLNEGEFDSIFLKQSALMINYITTRNCFPDGICVASSVMQLSESDYSLFWILLETVMRIKVVVLKQYFVYTVVPRYMVSLESPLNNCVYSFNSTEQNVSAFASQPKENLQNVPMQQPVDKQSRCFRSSVSRQKSDQQIQFQNHFSISVSHLLSIQTGQEVLVSELELCTRLNEHLRTCPKQSFWNALSELMQNKTARQLSDYYTNSYSKNQHKEQLTIKDKKILREMSQEMQMMKPAEVANAFLSRQKTQTYFKRNVVMYIINMRK